MNSGTTILPQPSEGGGTKQTRGESIIIGVRTDGRLTARSLQVEEQRRGHQRRVRSTAAPQLEQAVATSASEFSFGGGHQAGQ